MISIAVVDHLRRKTTGIPRLVRPPATARWPGRSRPSVWAEAALPAVVFTAAVLVAPPAVAKSCGDLLIVLDRSGSMANCMIDGESKEAIAKRAIQTVVDKFPDTPMGLFAFPNSFSNCSTEKCSPGVKIVDVQTRGGDMIKEFLSTMKASCGGTPTGSSLEAVAAYDGWDGAHAHYVLLITDGQPTCDDGDDGGMPAMMCDGQGSIECLNPTRAFDAIESMWFKDIHTFVIGFAGMGSGAGCTGTAGGEPFNKDTLNKMAELGGEMSEGDTKFWAATDSASLTTALDKIIGRVNGGTVMGCSGDDGMGGTGGTGGSGGMGGMGGGGGVAGQGGAGPGERPAHDEGCGCRASGSSGGDWTVSVILAAGLAAGRAGRVRRRSI